MSRYTYLAGGIIYILGVYFFIALSSIFLYHNQRKRSNENETIWQSLEAYFHGKPFNVTYESAIGNEKSWQYILWLFRVVSCCYFFGIGLLWAYIRSSGGAAHFFTIWNMDLITLYFFLSSIASTIGLFFNSATSASDTPNSIHLVKFGYAIQILFEITAASAFFVTVIAFGTLDHGFNFWNVVEHFSTTCAMLVELSLNKMDARFEHIVINLSWALLYLIFIWPVVAGGALTTWPYFFLDTDSTAIFAWYTILFVVDIIFFIIFWLIVRGKYALLKQYVWERVPQRQGDIEIARAVEL